MFILCWLFCWDGVWGQWYVCEKVKKFIHNIVDILWGFTCFDYDYSEVGKMMLKVGVTIVESKEGKVKEKYVETDTLLGATRFMNTYKPTRGHEVIQFRVEEVGRLV